VKIKPKSKVSSIELPSGSRRQYQNTNGAAQDTSRAIAYLLSANYFELLFPSLLLFPWGWDFEGACPLFEF